jgi:hypothetical protein
MSQSNKKTRSQILECGSSTGLIFDVVENECTCPSNYELIDGTCVCYKPLQSFPLCLDRECDFNFESIDSFLWNLDVDYYLSNASEIIGELAEVYGDGEPEAVRLASSLFNVTVSYPNCSAMGSLNLDCPYDQYYTLLMYAWDLVLYKCPQCHENQHVENNTCICDDSFFINATTGLCECPVFEEPVDGTCECLATFTRDSSSGRCICPEGFVINGTVCLPKPSGSAQCYCPENEYFNSIFKKCRCIENRCRNPVSGRCVELCDFCGNYEEYDFYGEECVCVYGMIRAADGNCTLLNVGP